MPRGVNCCPGAPPARSGKQIAAFSKSGISVFIILMKSNLKACRLYQWEVRAVAEGGPLSR